MLRGVIGLGATLCVGMLMAIGCSATDGSEIEGESGSESGNGSGMGQGSTGSGFGTGSSSSGGFNGEECGSETFGNQVPGTMLIVFDKSGSMSENNKYDATAQAINAMTSAATPDSEMGLLAFPEGNFDDSQMLLCIQEAFFGMVSPQCQAVLDDSGCQDVNTAAHVGIAPLTATASQINQYLNSNGPQGNTPTLYALRNAYQILGAHSSTGQKYALLITDGEPTVATPAMAPLPAIGSTCGSQADIENEVAQASQNGIATFVIGSPGSEPAAPFLSTLAVNGNTAKDPNCNAGAGDCHYQVGAANFQAELEALLEQIAGVIADCIFDVPTGEDVDPNLVNVTIETANGPVEVYKDASHTDGWDYTDGTQSKIQLYGPACELYKGEQGSTITIILGCESVVK